MLSQLDFCFQVLIFPSNFYLIFHICVCAPIFLSHLRTPSSPLFRSFLSLSISFLPFYLFLLETSVLLFLASLPFLFCKQRHMADCGRGESYGSSQEHEDASSEKKYGGLMPKKKPLITKDHARAFFDSADWALCKQGAAMNQESTVPMETLRPKLQRTPHQQLPPRRPACTSGRDSPAE
ncbi:uncharacterized protein LOC115665527 isoform X1 [Syzygium oleosum]|uniref:uncharacterized protein LOC115665527 isoform X1 n=1 Tax=Syzygium oleosum TaxID=219896 RepID=UPI0024BAEB60|nr:uncharacterized protein LOC115665527 isoform X1 [Syzygium oleosum]